MSRNKTTPAPGATGNEGHTSTNQHGTEHPEIYHLTAYIDAGMPVTKCRKRLKKGTFTSSQRPSRSILCPLCDAAQALEAVIW